MYGNFSANCIVRDGNFFTVIISLELIPRYGAWIFSVFSWYLDGNFHFSTPLTTSLSWCIYLIWMVILMCTVQFLDGKFSLSYQMSFLYLADIWMATFILVCNEHNSQLMHLPGFWMANLMCNVHVWMATFDCHTRWTHSILFGAVWIVWFIVFQMVTLILLRHSLYFLGCQLQWHT